MDLYHVYCKCFTAENKQHCLDLPCGVLGECNGDVLGEDVVVVCVLRDSFRKSRVLCFGTLSDIETDFQRCYLRGSDTLLITLLVCHHV